jgi:hypothetical protein
MHGHMQVVYDGSETATKVGELLPIATPERANAKILNS